MGPTSYTSIRVKKHFEARMTRIPGQTPISATQEIGVCPGIRGYRLAAASG